MKKIVLGFLVIASLGLAACGNNEAQTSETKASSTVTTDTMLTVKDSNGESVEVQQNPEKVVVFDNGSLDTLDALGVGDKVIGAATKNLPAYLEKYQEVESAGGIKEPDLEKINEMQPDLIIISGRQSDYQEQLSQIAPTLYLAMDAEKPWESMQENVTTLAKIFDKEKEAEEKLTDLTKQIDEVKEKASALDQTALVTLVNEGQLSAYGSGSRFGLVHDLFGFKQADDQIEASTHGQSVSYEYVLEKNPGILFVIDRTKAIGGDTSNDNVAANELVAQTDAGKNDQVISLQPDVWYLSGGGLESMNLMIEDVNQALK
ncbi:MULTISPECIES: siderophore ABC transporter substrate-binding protein [Enterococcus]|uniref:siderophore ABC transporter substrate-binding protein n=1 Tax=Enterococcus TaxID=1350 RepID=UPI00033100F2|nr:siderophore ABC transporter substrate-binding protein [Enterococcus mundtii]EOH65276.1 iron ABC transporter substrate-binding protein [Enterococcus mundtii ATCC 882]EOU14287.1 iron ABC transporter substrate-binding protein [Enterococcus mundtii ATCC 882]MBE9910313.1 siderophore ABC transporter substrate-binding protein [Enterococcus mundtii]MCA6773388.1 siderophore ABC transporter substrate-binding protein [Enterococcus mundtii]PJK26377.1 iron ABC transporter substrate-binding protein [Ente